MDVIFSCPQLLFRLSIRLCHQRHCLQSAFPLLLFFPQTTPESTLCSSLRGHSRKQELVISLRISLSIYPFWADLHLIKSRVCMPYGLLKPNIYELSKRLSFIITITCTSISRYQMHLISDNGLICCPDRPILRSNPLYLQILSKRTRLRNFERSCIDLCNACLLTTRKT